MTKELFKHGEVKELKNGYKTIGNLDGFKNKSFSIQKKVWGVETQKVVGCRLYKTFAEHKDTKIFNCTLGEFMGMSFCWVDVFGNEFE